MQYKYIKLTNSYFTFIALSLLCLALYIQNKQLIEGDISSTSARDIISDSKSETEQNNEEEPDFEQINNDFGAAGDWSILRCTPKNRVDCNGTECSESQPVVYLVLDRTQKTISRCDANGCDTYPSLFNSGGIFTNIQPDHPSGMIVKVLGNREYIEVVTMGLSSILQHGSCVESN